MIDGRFWLKVRDEPFLGTGRVRLLELIEQTGSIHAAAKEMKMSYKAAWDRIDAMNRLSGKPILERTVGGKGGGGTILTDHGKAMIRHYRRLEELHRRFLEKFSAYIDRPDEFERLLARNFITTSARNQLFGVVTNLTEQGIFTRVTIALSSSSHTLTSTITTKAAQELALKISSPAYAIVKSNDVAFALSPLKENDVNALFGTITAIEKKEDLAEITLTLDHQTSIIGIITTQVAGTLTRGQPAYALIPSSQIIIGV